jgi:tetratricopeptide (TPR) repeat protein
MAGLAASRASLTMQIAAVSLPFLVPISAVLAAQSKRAPALDRFPASQTDELTNRLANAEAARNAGNPAAVEETNALLIASAERELGDVRAAEGAYAQAVDLYKTSLALEPRTPTMLALATAEAEAGEYDEAIGLAERVRRTDPQSVEADRILSSSLIQKGKFADALAPLERVASTDHRVDTQYALANCLLQTKRPEDKARAQEIFHKIAAEHGDSGSLHVLMGRAYRDAGDLPSAITEFQRALAIDPRTPHANYFLGLAMLSQNEWRPTPEADAAIRKEAQFYPQDYLANYMSGFLLSGERRYDEAAPFLKTAADIDPSAPEPWLYLGLNAYAKGDMAGAESALRKAVVLTGSDEARSNYQIRRAYVDLGRILANSGRKDESETFLAKARDLQNKTMEQSQESIARMAGAEANAAAVISLRPAKEAKMAGADETAALDSATLTANPKLTPAQREALKQRETQLRTILALAYNDLGTSQAVQGNYAAAAGLYRKGEDWDSTLPGLEKNLGQSEFREGAFEAAVSPLTQALLQQPESHGLRAMLGISFFNLNRFAEAARTFAPLGRPGMQDSEVGYAWAASLARTGDDVKAAEVLTAFAAQQHPAEVQILIGQLWTAIGDYAKAVATMQQVLAADPHLPKAHLCEGLAYIHWEHWPEAAREFQAELAISPGDPDAEYHLGYVMMQQAKVDDALHLFEKVAAEHPNYANAQYQVGKIELDRGETDTAIAHLQAAERSSPQTAYIHYQLQAAYRKASRPDEAAKELALYKQLKDDARAQAAERASIH